MLRTNLSTRPFYNVRLVQAALAALVVVVAGITAANLWEALVLSGRHAALEARTAAAISRARALRDETARLRGATTPQDIEAMASAVRDVNALIGRRAFSWTELFNRFEETLPDSVRIASVQPRVEKDGSLVVTVAVLARDVEGVNAFMESLEEQGAFSSVLSREEFMNERGLLQATIEGRYVPRGPGAPARKGARP